MKRVVFEQPRANRCVTSLVALLFFLAAALQAAAATKVIRFGTLIDGTGRVFPNAVVAVEGDPLADITAISKREHVRWVMKAGHYFVLLEMTR